MTNTKPRDDTFKERQSFLFSATLLHTQGIHQKLDKKLKRAGMTVQDMIDKIEFRDPNPEYVNVSSATIMARSITETRVECLATEKDAILYYILLRHPGRTIVFVNSIDSIRRIVPLFSLLRVAVYPLHADMQQRQRLKNLERFKSNSDAVLIATDVAARGLDIPNIDHVIHYQLPRSADLYVHRSGRTARAKKEGISVMLCSPDQIPVYKKICFSLGKEDGVPVFPIDRSIMSSINKRIAAARKVDEAEHRLKKKQSEKDWFAKAAAEADIDLDDDVVSDNEVSRNDKENQTKIKQLKDALNGLLTQKLIPKGMSMKYLTSNTVADLPQILMASQTSGASLPAQKPQSALLAMVKK